MTDDSAPMPSDVPDRQALIDTITVLVARANRYTRDMENLNEMGLKERVDDVQISLSIALNALWAPLRQLIENTPNWAERLE